MAWRHGGTERKGDVQPGEEHKGDAKHGVEHKGDAKHGVEYKGDAKHDVERKGDAKHDAERKGDAKQHVVPSIIWNLQGLTEPRSVHADRNRRGLATAFAHSSKHVIVFVAQHRNSRLRREDVALFTELMRVYTLQPESTLVLFNRLPDGQLAAMRNLFVKLTGFSTLRFCAALSPLPYACDFGDESARRNARLVLELLEQCTPTAHTARGTVLTEQEQLEHARGLAEAAQERVIAGRQEHGVRMQDMEQRAAQLELAVAEVNRAYDGSLVEHDHRIAEIAAAQRENDNVFAQNKSVLEESIRQSAEFCAAANEAQCAVERQVHKNKNVVRQVGKAIEHMAHHPLKALPLIASVVLVPQATPALATALGCTQVAAGAALGAGVGAASAAATRGGNVLQGALCGALTAGGAFAAGSLTTTSAAMVRAGTSAAAGLVSRQNPLAAAAGSLVGSLVGGAGGAGGGSGAGGASGAAAQVALGATSGAASGAVTALLSSDRRNWAGHAAQGLVAGTIVGASAAAVASTRRQRTSETKVAAAAGSAKASKAPFGIGASADAVKAAENAPNANANAGTGTVSGAGADADAVKEAEVPSVGPHATQPASQERLFRQMDGSVCTKSEMLYATAWDNATDVMPLGAAATPFVSVINVRPECSLQYTEGIVGDPVRQLTASEQVLHTVSGMVQRCTKNYAKSRMGQ